MAFVPDPACALPVANLGTGAAEVIQTLHVGSEFDHGRIGYGGYYLLHLRPGVLFRVDIHAAPTVAEQLESIWQAFELEAMQLPSLFGISWQEFYGWRSGERVPAPAMQKRILALSGIVDQLRQVGVRRIGSLVLMKAFAGRSLMDLVLSDEWSERHLAQLQAEAKVKEATRKQVSKATAAYKPTSHWQSYLSIPGSIESA